jgi:hypothetical protein
MQTAKKRNFEFMPTRIGDATRYRVEIQCSKCPNTTYYECSKVLPDDVVTGNLTRRGWLLAKSRSFDLCPSCIGVSAENRLADRFTVRRDGHAIPPSREVVRSVSIQRAQDRSATIALIDRTFGAKPAQTAQATHPKPEPSPEPAVATPVDQKLSSLEKRLDTIGAALELMVEQQSLLLQSQQELAKQNHQQINAIANLAAMMGRTNEGVSSGLYSAVSALNALSTRSAPVSTPPVETAAPEAPRAPEPVEPAAPPAPAQPEPEPVKAAKPEPLPMKPLPRCKRKSKLGHLIDEKLARRQAEEAASTPPVVKRTRARARPVEAPRQPPKRAARSRTWSPSDIQTSA